MPSMRQPRALLAASLLALAAAAPPASPASPQDGGAKRDGAGKAAGKKDERPKPLKEGDAVAELVLELAGGGRLDVSGARSRPLVLVFAGSWAPESLDALRRLADPKGRLAGKDADLVGVLRDADAAAAVETAKKEKLTARLAADPKRRAYDRFAGRGLPYTVVVGKDGKVALSAAGFEEDAVLLKIDPPRPAPTKTGTK
jgi:peroxiredoxin